MEVKWILRYFRGTKNQALCFGGSNIYLQGFVDVDMAGNRDNKWSTIGYVFTIGEKSVSRVIKSKKLLNFKKQKSSMLLL